MNASKKVLVEGQLCLHIYLKWDMNNNKMKLLIGTIRDREKTLRDLGDMAYPCLRI